MTVCCAECGYDRNAADYTFCGRCGSALQRSASRVPRPASAAQADTFLNGPSFLGLSGPSTGVGDSQVEEPPLPNPWRARLALMMLLVAGLIFLLRHEGNSWRGLWDRRHELESSTSPIPSSNSPTETSSPIKIQSAEVAQSAPAPGHSNGSAPASVPPASTVSPDADNRKPESAAPVLPKPADKPQPVSVRPPIHGEQPRGSAVSTKQDELVAEGERYLYGDGVPQNCDRARTNLFVAAGQSNADAQAALGTMFATGHCVARDLPTAYRWFARAERKQPNNPRIEGDLRLLWKEMTPEEQNTAVHSTR